MYLEKRYRNRFKIASKGRVLLMVSAMMSCMSFSNAAPMGGVVSSGSATISSVGSATTIDQSSIKAVINWQDFSIAKSESVTFNQPSSTSMTLNRVVGSNQSVINGLLSANGKVYLVNQNGVLISKDAKVNTAGFLASTLNITDENFNKDNFVFEGDGTQGNVINLGAIEVKEGGYVVLLGKQVVNEGTIIATKGTVSLNSGDKITLNFNGNSLVDVTIDQGTLDALVETKQAIIADGGKIILIAKAADDLVASQVNIKGLVQAQTIDDLKGEVIAYAYNGTTTVSETIDASAPIKGDGGFIETSGDKVTIKDSANITTKSKTGKSGTWLIDPKDFTIGINADITGAVLSQQLSNNNVEIQSVNGATEGNGNIYVNDAVSWSQNKLTLNAQSSIYVNNVMDATGNASFEAIYGTGSNADNSPMGIYMAQNGNDGFTGKLNINSTGSVTLGGKSYQVINSIEQLQNIISGTNYVLGSDIDLSSIVDWTPIGYTGLQEQTRIENVNFNGLGHLISNITSTKGGLFAGSYWGGGYGNRSSISNIGVVNADIDFTATNSYIPTNIGILAAETKYTNIANVFTSGSLTANLNYDPGSYIGGLVGNASYYTNIYNSYSLASITAGSTNSSNKKVDIGGLVGYIYTNSYIYNSWYEGDINYTYARYVGGLIGNGLTNTRIYNSYAKGTISGIDETSFVEIAIGGLLGYSTGGTKIYNSYADVNIVANTTNNTVYVGGLVGGLNDTSVIIQDAYATGDITGSATYAGGFAGYLKGSSSGIQNITNVYASGNLLGAFGTAGGLAGYIAYTSITNAYALGNITSVKSGSGGGNSINIGGFVGSNNSSSTITNAYATGNVNGTTTTNDNYYAYVYAGGFVGSNSATITDAYATGDVTASASSGTEASSYARTYAGGFVGSQSSSSAAISNAYATGDVTSYAITPLSTLSTSSYNYSGGFVGYFNNGTITNMAATGAVDATTGSDNVILQSGNLYGFMKSGLNITEATTDILTDSAVWVNGLENPTLLAFDSGLWGSSISGQDILKTMGVTFSSSALTYGDTFDLSSVTVRGLQGGDSIEDVFSLADLSSYLSDAGVINAGGYNINALVNPSTYSKLNGIVIVNPKTVDINANTTIANKTYDTTSQATVTSSGGSVSGGVLTGDSVILGNATAYFSDKNAGNNKTVYVDYYLENDDGSLNTNYIAHTTATADITPKIISAIFSANDKIYDGTTIATVASYNSGAYSSDTVNLSWQSASYSDKNAGNNKIVTLSGLALSGQDSGNYILSSTSTIDLANITPLALVFNGAKDSDGTANVSASHLSPVNVISGDRVKLSGSATLVGNDIGMQQITDFSTLTLDNANYTLNNATGYVTVGNANLKLNSVVSGDVSVSTNEKTTTITQTTPKAIVNWNKFSIASNEIVNFLQPNSSSIILNKVVGNEKSIIDGILNANGKVFIINSNGILFSSTAKVNTASLLASTLNISNEDFLNSHYIFKSTGSIGNIINEGDIVIVDEGFASFISENDVENKNKITATNGDVILASINNITLNLDSNNNLNSYAISNVLKKATANGEIKTNLLEVAGNEIAIDSNLLLDTGSNGTLSLTKDSITVGSDISGDFIQAQLSQRSLSLNTLTGDITVDDGFDWSANTLTLNSAKNIWINDVINASNTAGFTGIYGSGNNADASPYYIYMKQGENDSSMFRGKINLTSNDNIVYLGTKGKLQQYTIWNELDDLPFQGWMFNGTISGNYILGADLDLSSFSKKTIANWDGNFNGFGHVMSNLTISNGAFINNFGGKSKIDAQVNNATYVPAMLSNFGLVNLNVTDNATGGLISQNTGIIANSFVTGTLNGETDYYLDGLQIGGMAGSNGGEIYNSYTNVDIHVRNPFMVGGFVGENTGLIMGSHSLGNIWVIYNSQYDTPINIAYYYGYTGGFVGFNTGRLINDYASVDIHLTGGVNVGGFVGGNGDSSIAQYYGSGGYISNSYATGNITGTVNSAIGGFAGLLSGSSTIEDSYSIGNVNVTGDTSNGGTSSTSNWGWIDGEIPTGSYVGGFVGLVGDSFIGVDNSVIKNSHSTGNVSTDGMIVGGFAGQTHYNTRIENSSSSGNVKGKDYVGGFVGVNGSYIYYELLQLDPQFNEAVGRDVQVEENLRYHFGNGNAFNSPITGATITGSNSSGTVEATAANAKVGAFAAENIVGGNLTDNYITGDGMDQANTTGVKMIGASGRGDGWGPLVNAGRDSTSTTSENNFGSSAERTQWAAEAATAEQARQEAIAQAKAEAQQQVQLVADRAQTISERLNTSAQKDTKDILGGLMSLFSASSPKHEGLMSNVNVIQPKFETDVKNITVDGVTYSTEELNEDEEQKRKAQ